MKVLIDSYSTVKQNKAGGIQMRISKYIHYVQNQNIYVKKFDKWQDKIEDYDLLHIFKVNIESYNLIKLAKSRNIPVVISSVMPMENKFRVYMSRYILQYFKIKTVYWFIENMFSECNVIIAQTEKEANFINKVYGVNKNKIKVIPNGANVEMGRGDKELIKKKLSLTKPYVLQVGRFDENKNQLNIIRALKGMDIPVVFIGGPDKDSSAYYEKCKKEASDNFYFLGWIDNDDPLLASAYSGAKVVILPSYKEIFGNSLIEGGAAGANLIATKELPINEWGIKEFCKCIDPYNIKDIRNKVKEEYDKPLNKHTAQIITEKFSWENVAYQHISIYKQIVKKDGE